MRFIELPSGNPVLKALARARRTDIRYPAGRHPTGATSRLGHTFTPLKIQYNTNTKDLPVWCLRIVLIYIFSFVNNNL
jgi:hypothetical protein